MLVYILIASLMTLLMTFANCVLWHLGLQIVADGDLPKGLVFSVNIILNILSVPTITILWIMALS